MIGEWLPKIMIQYKDKILTFDESEEVGNDVSREVISLCDDNVNRLFGWALWKMKRKYEKLIIIGSMNILHDGKLNMLDDMIVMVDDIIDDIPYIRRYYPLDDALRNKGSLTLVSPKFVREFSSLLKLIDLTLEPCINDDKISIPDKKMVIEQMKEIFVTDKRNLVNVICETSKII
jgi:hypothetical protein